MEVNQGPRLSATMTVLVIFIALAFSITACVKSVPEPRLMPGPRLDPLPLRMGVYFPSELKNFTYKHHATDTTYVLGDPSVRLLHEALAVLFAEIVESPAPQPGAALQGGLAGVIEPRIVSAGYRYPRLGTMAFRTHITYGFTLYSPPGKRLATWEVTGRASRTLIRQGFESAMQEAALKFIGEFRDVPQVRRWLEK